MIWMSWFGQMEDLSSTMDKEHVDVEDPHVILFPHHSKYELRMDCYLLESAPPHKVLTAQCAAFRICTK